MCRSLSQSAPLLLFRRSHKDPNDGQPRIRSLHPYMGLLFFHRCFAGLNRKLSTTLGIHLKKSRGWKKKSFSPHFWGCCIKTIELFLFYFSSLHGGIPLLCDMFHDPVMAIVIIFFRGYCCVSVIRGGRCPAHTHIPNSVGKCQKEEL